LVLGRRPDDAEERAARNYFQRHVGADGLAAFCQALLNVNEFIYLE
jgi:hypothetical protein